jgi:hypothetical protein
LFSVSLTKFAKFTAHNCASRARPAQARQIKVPALGTTKPVGPSSQPDKTLPFSQN